MLLFSFVMAIFFFVLTGLILAFYCRDIDRIKHPKERESAGESGERTLYNTLVKKIHIPENQIFRNVYIPTSDNRTSEIDLIVVSKKGLFIFECKNYGGNIYGDANRPKWIQYIGNQKNFFYSPLLQNKNHVKHLSEFFAKYEINVPIVPVISTTTRGSWKIKNLRHSDYVLGFNCNFKDVYASLEDSKTIAKHYKTLLNLLTPLSCPDPSIRAKHINDLTYLKG